MNVIKHSMYVGVVALSLGIAACAQQPYRDGYARGYGQSYSASKQICENCGVVMQVEQVYIERNDSTVGTLLGAIIGGALGNTVGHGRGRSAATIVGAVAGGAVGNAMGKRNGRQVPAWRIVMRMSDGRIASLIQRQQPQLRRGDAVVIRAGRIYPRWR